MSVCSDIALIVLSTFYGYLKRDMPKKSITTLPFCVCGWNGNDDFGISSFFTLAGTLRCQKVPNGVFVWEIIFWLVQKILSLQFRWYLDIRGNRIFNPSPSEFLSFLQIRFSYFYLLEIKDFLAKFSRGLFFLLLGLPNDWK